MPYPEPEALLPHRRPALLIEAVVEACDRAVVCLGRVRTDHPMALEGEVPALLGLEMGAQAGAVMAALREAGGGGPSSPRIGYLVGLKRCVLHVRTLPVEVPLRVRATRVGGAGPLSVFSVAVSDGDGNSLVEGTVSCYAAEKV